MDVSGRMGIKKLSEGGKQAERDARPDFRVRVVGSNPAGPTTSRTGPIVAKIFGTLWELKKRGYCDITLKAKGERLRHLAKHVNARVLKNKRYDISTFGNLCFSYILNDSNCLCFFGR